jgi:hypothetical protein
MSLKNSNDTIGTLKESRLSTILAVGRRKTKHAGDLCSERKRERMGVKVEEDRVV